LIWEAVFRFITLREKVMVILLGGGADGFQQSDAKTQFIWLGSMIYEKS
jgi:hypothetical protein